MFLIGQKLGAILKTKKVACEDSEIGPSGGFYQDRESVAKHLPLAWSKESQADRNKESSRPRIYVEHTCLKNRIVAWVNLKKLLEMLDQYYEQTKAK